MHANLDYYAKNYINAGLSVIPAGFDKRPTVKEWKSFQSKFMDEWDIKKNFLSSVDYIAIIGGRISGNVEAIDIDLKYDLSGTLEQDYQQLIKELGGESLLKRLVIATTRSAGRHYIYKCETVAGNQKLASRETTEVEKQKNPKEKVKVLIETRGEGGYFICAPSPGYNIIQGNILEIPLLTVEERNILFDAGRALNEIVKSPDSTADADDKIPGLSPCDDYNKRGDVVKLLVKHGWSVVSENTGKVTLKRPGDSDTKYSAYYHRDKNWFTVFSTSTEFEAQKAYLPYAVYAVLECSGNFKAATKKLAAEGYGSYPTTNKKKEPVPAAAAKPDTKKIKEKNTAGKQFENVFKYLSEHHKLIKNSVTELLEDSGKEVTDDGINSLYINLSKHYEVTKTNFDIAINSEYIQRYNPIHNFFLKNQHLSSTGHIEELISCLDVVTGFKDGDFSPLYAHTFIKKWLVGLVASAFDKNYNPLMIVLISKPNTGKTYFFRHLLPKELENYFAESKFSEGKDDEALMCSKLLILNDELAFSSNIEARTFRNFISANTYTFRPPYKKSNITKKRLASVCGTSNDKEVVKDPENNRRIIPIEISKINHEIYNSVNKIALLMEAYNLYQSGFDWNLTQAEIEILMDNTKEYASVIVERDLINKSFRIPAAGDIPVKKSVGEIVAELTRIYGIKANAVIVGKCLSELGFTQKMTKIPGSRNSERKYLVCYTNEADIQEASS